jgi:hypothetical protein
MLSFESGLQNRVPRFNSGRGLHNLAEKSASYAKSKTDKADRAGAQSRGTALVSCSGTAILFALPHPTYVNPPGAQLGKRLFRWR